jgi:hypothetical protein
MVGCRYRFNCPATQLLRAKVLFANTEQKVRLNLCEMEGFALAMQAQALTPLGGRDLRTQWRIRDGESA